MSYTEGTREFEAAPVAQPALRQRRSGCGLPCLLAGILLLLLVCAGVCGGVVWFLVASVRHTEPYRIALAAVREDPTVVERLGEPIEDGWIAAGDVSRQNGRGEAHLAFDVRGSKEPAAVEARARMREGVWRLVSLEVIFVDGERYAVPLAPAEDDEVPEALEEAPLRDP